MNKIVVRIADFKIGCGSDVLVTFGLGSCLAVSIYEPGSMTAGMAHIMLPGGALSAKQHKPRKFADLCIIEMIEELKSRGCRTTRMVAKIAGGACMFDFPAIEGLGIGQRNRESVIEVLRKINIPVIGEDTGGRHGRTVEFLIENGEMMIRSLKAGTRVI